MEKSPSGTIRNDPEPAGQDPPGRTAVFTVVASVTWFSHKTDFAYLNSEVCGRGVVFRGFRSFLRRDGLAVSGTGKDRIG